MTTWIAMRAWLSLLFMVLAAHSYGLLDQAICIGMSAAFALDAWARSPSEDKEPEQEHGEHENGDES